MSLTLLLNHRYHSPQSIAFAILQRQTPSCSKRYSLLGFYLRRLLSASRTYQPCEPHQSVGLKQHMTCPPLGRQRHRISSSSSYLMYPTASLLQFCSNIGITGRSNGRSNVMLGCTPCDGEDSAEFHTCAHGIKKLLKAAYGRLGMDGLPDECSAHPNVGSGLHRER